MNCISSSNLALK